MIYTRSFRIPSLADEEHLYIRTVAIPACQGIVGSDREDESPPTKVGIAPLWISVDPITNRQFATFIRHGGYNDSSNWDTESHEWLRKAAANAPAFWNDERYNGDEQPVTGISFYEADAFASWVGGRLPTEVEWEIAGRGVDGANYPWGDEPPTPELANFAPEFIPSRRAPCPVDLFPNNISPFGCRQMSGNVFEWCSDFFHVDTPRRRCGVCFKETRRSNRRVLKGGAWTTDDDRIRIAARWSYTPDLRDNILGFRVVFDAATDS